VIDTVIIEDEVKTRGLLKSLLKEYCPDVELRGEADSVETGLELIEKLNPTLVFLDVELGEGNAFDLLTRLPKKNFHIIFTTAHDHYAVRAIKFSAIDYLLKPINSIDLKAAVEKVKSKSTDTLFNNVKMLMTNFSPPGEKQSEKIALPTFDGHIFVNLNDIIRFEAEGNYSYVYTTDGNKIMVSKTLKDFEDFINPGDFVRIHHAHIINLKHVKRYVKGRGGFVIMDDGSKAEVSTRKKEEFLHKMHIN
jgi:two-component system, LytTR family, response regulator